MLVPKSCAFGTEIKGVPGVGNVQLIAAISGTLLEHLIPADISQIQARKRTNREMGNLVI